MIPIPPYIPSWSPVPVVTPFTYRDGVTMLKKVDGIIRYLNRTIVPFINETNQELADKVEHDINNMINVVNTAIANLESETDTKLAAMQQTVNDAIAYVNTTVANLTTYVDTNIADLRAYVDEQVQLIINDGIQVQDPVVAGIFGNPASQTRVATDALYANKGTQTTVETGRLSVDNIRKRTLSVNVKEFGATPNEDPTGVGSTVKIQSAIDYVEAMGGGNVWIDDEFWIKAHDETAPPGNSLVDRGGIALKDGVFIRMTNKANLKAITNSEIKYNVIRVFSKTNCGVIGGKITGDLPLHGYTSGNSEWGYGINVTGGSNITIDNIYIKDIWGDGIIVDEYGSTIPNHIYITNVISDGNRRQGLSIVAGDQIHVADCQFINTGISRGTLPMNGIDIEPWNNTLQCSNIVIERVLVKNNNGFGIGIYMLGTRDVRCSDIIFDSNKGVHQYVNNLCGPNITLENSRFYNTVTQCVQMSGGTRRVFRNNIFDNKVRISQSVSHTMAYNVTIEGNRFVTNAVGTAISGLVEINEDASHTKVINNHFESLGLRGSGVWIRRSDADSSLYPNNVEVSGNTMINMSNAIISGECRQLIISRNQIDASSATAISLQPASDALIVNNRISGSNLVSGIEAIQFAANTVNTVAEGNKIEIDPYATVVETRRGTHAFSFSFGPTLNTFVRNTNLKGALSMYQNNPNGDNMHTNTFLETTPGSWQALTGV